MNKLSQIMKKKSVRVAVGIAVPLAVVAGALILLFVRVNIPCVFYELTSLYCPGCGSTRAAKAIMHLDFGAAFGYNPLFVLFLPIALYYLLKIYIKYVFEKDVLPFPKYISGRLGVVILVVILLFGILRNIPVYPFNLLAP